MAETRKIAAILAADVVGFSRMASADEDRTLARLRSLRAELIDPTVTSQNGRVFKRTGDGALVEFRSVVEAVRCAVGIQNAMIERNSGISADQRIEFRIGIHLGDVVEESDGDLMGEGVNIAARLEGIAQPGAICLSEDAYRQVRARLDLAVADLGPTQLKNIAEPVRVYSLQVAVPAHAKPEPRISSAEKSVPPHLSIVVLPFANMSGLAEQDYFVDGVTESLTTDLSRMNGMLVIGRNTAFTYKGKAVDLKLIGRELNVRYVLEGSVQRGGNRMRVSVQLIDAETGSHLWAERFDKSVADLFDMQDEIVAHLANALSTQLVTAEARRAERTSNPDATDLCFRGMAWFYKEQSSDNLSKARVFYESALALDADNVDALLGLAAADVSAAMNYLDDERIAHFRAAEVNCVRVLALDPDNARAHMYAGAVQINTNRATQGVAECERALALDRNLAHAHGYIAAAKYFIGRGEETEEHVRAAFRLSPRDRSASLWLLITGTAKLYLGQCEEAVSWMRQSIEAKRDLSMTHFFLAAALALLGRIAEARLAVEAGHSLNPTFTISRWRSGAPSNNPIFLAQRECVIEGLRKAGMSEE
jgi:TolB-like protein/class 3 adenylate cyclase